MELQVGCRAPAPRGAAWSPEAPPPGASGPHPSQGSRGPSGASGGGPEEGRALRRQGAKRRPTAGLRGKAASGGDGRGLHTSGPTGLGTCEYP